MKTLTSRLLILTIVTSLIPVTSAQITKGSATTRARPGTTQSMEYLEMRTKHELAISKHILTKPGKKMELNEAMLGELIQLLNEDDAFNVVISDEANILKIPSIKGENMSVLSILSIVEASSPTLEVELIHRAQKLNLASAENFVDAFPSRQDDWTILCRLRETTPQENDPFAAAGMGATRASSSPQESDPFGGTQQPLKIATNERGVYSVGPMLNDKLDIEALASAIELVWEGVTPTVKPTIKMHEHTGLLFCSGSAEHIDLTDQVISQLPHGAEVLLRSLTGRPASTENEGRLKQLSSAVEPEKLKNEFQIKLKGLERDLQKRCNDEAQRFQRRAEEAEARVGTMQHKLDQREEEIIQLRRTLMTEKP